MLLLHTFSPTLHPTYRIQILEDDLLQFPKNTECERLHFKLLHRMIRFVWLHIVYRFFYPEWGGWEKKKFKWETEKLSPWTETEWQRRKIYGMRFNVMQSYQYCKHLVFASLLKWTTTLCTFEYINNITCVRLSLSFSAFSVCVCGERFCHTLLLAFDVFLRSSFFDMNANFGPWHEFNIYVHCKQNKHIERRCIAITSLIFFALSIYSTLKHNTSFQFQTVQATTPLHFFFHSLRVHDCVTWCTIRANGFQSPIASDNI